MADELKNPRNEIAARTLSGRALIAVGERVEADGSETTMVVIEEADGKRSDPMPMDTALRHMPGAWLTLDEYQAEVAP